MDVQGPRLKQMAKIAHIVNLFDPACDVLRCYKELRRFSRYEHRLFVKDLHPLQGIYQYDQHHNDDRREDLLEWCDAVIYHFVGWEGGPDRPEKPAAFRNINIRWNPDTDKFWCEPQYNAASLDRYKLLASCAAPRPPCASTTCATDTTAWRGWSLWLWACLPWCSIKC